MNIPVAPNSYECTHSIITGVITWADGETDEVQYCDICYRMFVVDE